MTSEELLAEVGHNIAFARGARRMTGTDLARRLGVTKAAVSMWEHGRNLTVQRLIRIAHELGVEPSDLLRVQ